MMTVDQAKALGKGAVLTYADGRQGHQGVRAVVLTVSDGYLIAQFEDRADTTKIEFVREWLDHLSLEPTIN